MATAKNAWGLELRTRRLRRNIPEAKNPTDTTSPMRPPATASEPPRQRTTPTRAMTPATVDGSSAPRNIAPKGAPACGSVLGVGSVIGDRPLRVVTDALRTACESYHKQAAPREPCPAHRHPASGIRHPAS